uniref:Calcineurin-like phosphoesterase domain-containing protein n=1 Tax=Hordeum vulgare subsp. vulgare TaxID=112509 RepID=A0A8I7B0V6_HORVV
MSRHIRQVYGVYDECLCKYGSMNVWRCCTGIFDYLSLSTLIENKISNVHGGLSLGITTLDEVNYSPLLFHLEKGNQELNGDLKDMYINTSM